MQTFLVSVSCTAVQHLITEAHDDDDVTGCFYQP